jgi:hypothetical protein
MTLRLVGAGVGRTGTHSLKLALETLLGAPCYHMLEVFQHLEHVPSWHAAARGEPVDWDRLLTGYTATVDWPAAAFWPELSAAYPDAVVLLSVRESADAWWRSASATIFDVDRRGSQPGSDLAPWEAMAREVTSRRFAADVTDEQGAKAAYERHNAEVRSTVPSDRLVEWRPGDGWEPLCGALGLPVPDLPFPHVNTTAQFREMMLGGGPPGH